MDDNHLDAENPLLSSDYAAPHAAALAFYARAARIGKLDPAPPDSPATTLRILWYTLPLRLLLLQLAWSLIVVVLHLYALQDDPNADPLRAAPLLNVPPAVILAAAFSLFILLGFLVSDSTTRHRAAAERFRGMTHALRHVARKTRLDYPRRTWHFADRDRIAAHLAAVPVALKMHLLNQRDATQLAPLLHSDDIRDVLAAPEMHLHCVKVVRAYFSSAEDDAVYSFPSLPATKTPPGTGTRFHIITLLDQVEFSANELNRLASFRPAQGYVNHLSIFIHVWAIFLPPGLVTDSRWYTPLWSVLITYAIATLSTVATALSDPFKPSPTAVPLNALAARAAAYVLRDAATPTVSYQRTVRPTSTTPDWLTRPLPSSARGFSPHKSRTFPPSPSHRAALARFLRVRFSFPAVLSLTAIVAWAAFIVFLTWGLSRNRTPPRDDGDRWWSVQVPLSNTATGYASLGLFLLLTFWTTDAYGRFWRGLLLWQADVRPHIGAYAHAVSLMMHAGFWHDRDHERILAHLTALPVAMKLHLRDSHDLSELRALLDEQDVQAFEEDVRELPVRCMDVLMAYLDSADAVEETVVAERNRPIFVTAFTMQASLWEADRALWECVAMKEAPIAPAFTLHVRVFAAIWLAMLAITIVQHDGFLSFLYLVPIGYSVLNLIQIGMRLTDPFGCDDEDIPLDELCEEIRDSIHRIYLSTRGGTRAVIQTSEHYDRAMFQPRAHADTAAALKMSSSAAAAYTTSSGETATTSSRVSSLLFRWKGLFNSSNSSASPLMSGDLPTLGDHVEAPTLLGTIRNGIARLPAISLMSYVAVTLWSVAAVYASWGLSTLWEGQDRGECRRWCSPIDVQGDVLANIGFALFLILSFRAADALQRFDNGAVMLQDMMLQMRGMALDFVQVFPTGFFHPGDKERVVAHIVQIPLCLRDILLGASHGRSSAAEGLLSETDRKRFVESPSPIEHLLESIEAYILLEDSPIHLGWDLAELKAPPPMIGPQLGRLIAIRQLISRVTSTKRFAVVPSYRRHERMFTFIWLALLPLSMTSDTGFFTILWAPLISYGVLILQDISEQLVDPFGCDPNDLPLQRLCANAANAVLEAVHATGWDTDRLCTPPAAEENEKGSLPITGAQLRGGGVEGNFVLPRLDESDEADSEVSLFDARAERRTERSLFTHLLLSTPWLALALTFLWALVACAISSVTRERTSAMDAAWWRSSIAITSDVVNGASFGAFTLLGFFVSAAYSRFERAGGLWEGRLRAACHALAANVYIFYRDDAIHARDKNRLLGLIAAIPLLLKAELRDSRDVRDVSALMTSTDLARVSRADSMTLYCTSVVRAWLTRIVLYSDKLLNTEKSRPGGRGAFVRAAINNIEGSFQEAMFLKTFGISPVFKTLTKTLLAIWFMLLPFILFDVSGWLTLLWTPLIAYGIIGMYAIGNELQEPFGTDLNSHDIDEVSHSIVRDVLHVQHSQKPPFKTINSYDTPPASWTAERLKELDKRPRPVVHSSRGRWSGVRRAVKLATTAVPFWQLLVLAVWGGAVVGLAFLIESRFDMNACSGRWFCTFISIDSDIKEYTGFALFLLLGFRLTDSHARYVRAQQLWHEGIIGLCRLLSNRFLESFAPGSYHDGDVDRICGHIAALPIVLAANLRTGTNCSSRLRTVLGEKDVQHVMKSPEPVLYCLDVMRGYLFYTETLDVVAPDRNGMPGEVQFKCLEYVEMLQEAAFECRRVARVQVPFGYLQHLRVFMAIYLGILPIGLVQFTGWLAVVWVVLIGYGVIGVQQWADQLADPFGCDESDVPLLAFSEEAVDAVRWNMALFPKQALSFVDLHEQRRPFPAGGTPAS